jgi:hypothetical protein
MRRADTWTIGEGYWGHKMDALLGQYLTPLVMLTDGPEDSKAIARELRKAMLAPPLKDMVARVRSLDDLLPPDQAERQSEVERIRKKLTPNVRNNLTDEQRKAVDKFLGQAPAPAIELGAIPDPQAIYRPTCAAPSSANTTDIVGTGHAEVARAAVAEVDGPRVGRRTGHRRL